MSKQLMHDVDEVELRYQYFNGDAALLRKILVDNPARLRRHHCRALASLIRDLRETVKSPSVVA